MPRHLAAAGQSHRGSASREVRATLVLRLKQIDANLVRREHVRIGVVLASSVHRACGRRTVEASAQIFAELDEVRVHLQAVT